MNVPDAMAFISDAVPEQAGGIWADIGAGDGTFTRALVELLGRESRIYAVDQDEDAVASIDRWTDAARWNVVPVVADFSRPFELPDRRGLLLDGLLFANSLHFVRDAAEVVARLAWWVKPGGRFVFVEYDRRGSSQWVPYPVSPEKLRAVAALAGLSSPTIVARRASLYGGDLYAAVATRERARAPRAAT